MTDAPAAARTAWAGSDASAATPCAPSGAWPPRLTARTSRPACTNSVTTALPMAPVAPKTTCKDLSSSVIVMLPSGTHSAGRRASAKSSVCQYVLQTDHMPELVLDPPYRDRQPVRLPGRPALGRTGHSAREGNAGHRPLLRGMPARRGTDCLSLRDLGTARAARCGV